jgi:hypothetical protein
MAFNSRPLPNTDSYGVPQILVTLKSTGLPQQMRMDRQEQGDSFARPAAPVPYVIHAAPLEP